MPSRFLYRKVTISPFVINSYPVGRISWEQNDLDWLRLIKAHSLGQGKGSDTPEHMATTYLNKTESRVKEEVAIVPAKVTLHHRLYQAWPIRTPILNSWVVVGRMEPSPPAGR